VHLVVILSARHCAVYCEDNTVPRYLVVIQLKNASPARLRNVIPELLKVLTKMSGGHPAEQVFRSATGDLFGYLVSSKLNAAQIHAGIESPGDRYMAKAEDVILEGGDATLVVEVGKDFTAGHGFTRVGTWLQRHP
jgi:hypothetical protein